MQASTWSLVLVSIALHAVVATVLGGWATDLKQRLESTPTGIDEVSPAIPFAYACTVDVSAMTGARLAYCASPVVADKDECAARALAGYQTELILCEMQQTDLPALSAVQPSEVRLIDAAAVAAIKPQPLIPALPPQDPQEIAKNEQEKDEEKAQAAKK